MIDVRVNGKLAQLPESWADLKQNMDLYKKAMKLFDKLLPVDVYLLSFGLMALGVPRWKWKYVNSETVIMLQEHLLWMVEDFFGGLNELIFSRFGSLYGPKNFFDHLETWEFSVAERHFFASAEDELELDKFIAVLYRKKRTFQKKNGDVRIDFNDNRYLQHIRQIAKIPTWKKRIVWQWFLQQREDAVRLHSYLFPEITAKEGAKMSWVDTIIAISAPGDEEKSAKVSIGLMLRRLDLSAKEQAALRAKTEKDED